MGLFAETGLPTLLVLAVLGLTIGLLLLRSHRYLARQDKGGAPLVRTPRPGLPRQSPHLDAPADVALWEVSMHETARDLSGQLDSKMGALAHLIREADRAATRLEAALEMAQRPPGSTLPPDQPTRLPGSPMAGSDRLPALPPSQAEALKSAGAARETPIRRGIPNQAGRTRPSGDHRYEEIYLLADYGFDAAEIARRVGSPVGEVELILGLRAKR